MMFFQEDFVHLREFEFDDYLHQLTIEQQLNHLVHMNYEKNKTIKIK